MKVLLVVICIAVGGAFGAVLRHLGVNLMHLYIGLPSWIAVMIINITGCYFIGLCFFYLEAHLRRNGGSRLCEARIAGDLNQLTWWPDGDPTQPAVDLFRRSLYLDLLSGLFITGFMGAFTTFSLLLVVTPPGHASAVASPARTTASPGLSSLLSHRPRTTWPAASSLC